MVSGSADYGGLFLGADQIADREREKRRGVALDFGVYKLGREKRHGFLQAVFGILQENPEGRRGAAADNEVGERLLARCEPGEKHPLKEPIRSNGNRAILKAPSSVPTGKNVP